MSQFIRDFKDGLRSYGTALKIIRAQKLWIYMLIPGLISLAFGVTIVFFAQAFSSNVSDFIEAKYPWEFGAAVVRRLAGWFGGAIVWAGSLMTYKYVVLILVAPFMSPLSERVEAYMTGHRKETPNLSAGRFLKEIFRGVKLTIRNLIRELLLTALVFIITAILPILSFLSAPAIFLVQSYYAGFGNMDYTLERHFEVKESVEFVKDYKGFAVGNGLPFLLLLAIPVAGVFLAPSLATVSATVETIDRLRHEGRL